MPDFLKLKKSNCKNCYKCIRHCPVKSIRFSAGQANIVGDECILCGQCFVVCPQNAKQISDDTEKVKVMFQSNSHVIASIAPSFIANYNGVGIENMEKALKLLGFYAAEETAIGATIVKKEYERILKVEKPDILISSACHSVNLLIQKYFPAQLKYLAHIVSPMQAHAIDLKKRYPEAKVVFIGPCVAKKDEADRYDGIVDAVLTFEELSNLLAEKNISFERGSENCTESRARLFPIAGGIIKTMECNFEEYSYISIDGAENCIAALRDIEAGEISHCFIEMSACVGSCIGGPVMEKYHRSPVRDYMKVNSYAGVKDFNTMPLEQNKIKKSIGYITRNQSVPDESEIMGILRQMGKTKLSQELNCGSCGYNTCREKAIAIYQGKADFTMCMPFLKEKAEIFSNSIIGNTPNGIIIVNENLEVQQINKAACTILNIKNISDVLGEQLIRILDPKNFMQVIKTGKNIRDKLVYLAEYNKYIEQTIIHENEFKNILCIMRDVTSEEIQKLKKEQITQRTIEVADKVVDKQMRIVQEIASLLGETAAETKIALAKLKESITDE